MKKIILILFSVLFLNQNVLAVTLFEALTEAYKNNLDLHIVISPYHSRKLQLIKLKGLQNKFDNWKRNLTLLNEKVALDVEYMKKQSIWFDIKIFCITLIKAFIFTIF